MFFFPRNVLVFSWLQFLLILPLIHHICYCLVNTLSSIDLCFPTALVSKLLILCQSKHSSFLLCNLGAEYYWGQSLKYKEQNPTNYGLLSARLSVPTILPSVGLQCLSPAFHRNYLRFSPSSPISLLFTHIRKPWE